MKEKKGRKEEKNEVKLEAVLSGIDEGIVVINKNYKILSTNRAFINNLRYPREKVIGEYCYEVIHGYSKPCRRCVARKTFKSGKFCESTHSHLQKNGSKIYHETKSYPLKDLDGKTEKVIYIFRDVTERKRAEEEIKDLKEHNENIVASVPSPILVIKEDLKIVSANKSFYKNFKLKKEEVENKSLEEVLPPRLSKEISRAIQGKVFFKKRETEDIFPEVGEKILSVSLRRMGAKKNREVLIVIEDISERKKLEEELIKSGKLAALGELLAELAHEINNPLAVISGYIQLLLQNESRMEKNKKERYLKEIFTQTERAAKIVERVRSFARPAEPKMEFTDINKTLIKILSLIKEEAHFKNIKIREDFDFSLPQIKADKDQLEEIFLNIILNAFQAMPQGGDLNVRTSLKERGVKTASKKAIEVRVADTGSGISKKNLGRIFDPFFTTKDKNPGLGLSIVHTLVEKHNGTINIESELNKGTKVVILFPSILDEKKDE